ncbi:hypothetical protein V8G54_008000, partial [Vigna mungo]
MNGKIIGQKPLYVAVAQLKEERKANLQVIVSFLICKLHLSLLALLDIIQLILVQEPQAIGYGFQPHVLPQSMCGIATKHVWDCSKFHYAIPPLETGFSWTKDGVLLHEGLEIP